MSRTQVRGRGNVSTIPAQDIYESLAEKTHRLGERLQLGDRVFYFAEASEALTAGKLCTVNPTTNEETAVTTAHGVGTYEVDVTAASQINANRYSDGYLNIFEGTGAGEAYKIKSHPDIANGDVGTFELYDAIATAWDTGNTDVVLQTSPFYVQEADQAQKQTPIGVPVTDFDSGDYGWVQTWGPCSTLVEGSFGSTSTGRSVTISPNTDGAVEPVLNVGEPFVGQVLTDGADVTSGYYELILLQIMP